ncbi:ABC transporter ATP-binding protein [Mangrovibacterium marinum]|uniref:Phospholipid/cholesterol/gamma-HCH transport system ATP-binding protein n=1 Tax=Mangrovibacterium marinum TaxID=1639118 RepID=A0A2T5C6M9_9BACT|nr:ATP-binding cassette domain-containing protein [Mangrovibacterium marinum]PTN10591.1 phospholipid/cholesterol/gamma-HCH transport system ATP-binding protein [Mangrovibacterium marinum]
MIRVENIIKSFDSKMVLKGITTEFQKGQTNLIIGRSGSGKTVLLKSIVGLHEVDQGEIYYDDRNFTRMKMKERKRLRQEMGMVFQGGALFDSLTVAENVRFPMDMFTNQTAKEKEERVAYCLDRVNIKPEAFRLSPAEISGGMQKRVAIARAIVLNPKYLFCDEPNSGLDPETSLVIDSLIHDLTVDLNMTTIINTHDMNSVMEIGDKILFISEGEMGWIGSKSEILHAKNKKLEEFVFANRQYKEMRDARIENGS